MADTSRHVPADGVYVVDASRTITSWDAAAEALSGFRADEVVGHWCGDGLLNHVDEDGRPLCGDGCPLQATIADGMSRKVRILLHHRDGHLMPVEVSASALRDEAGAIVGAVETFRADPERPALADDPADPDPPAAADDRTALAAHLADRLAALRQWGVPLTVLLIGVDGLPGLDEAYGPGSRDRTLAVVAETVRHCLPRRGRAFRYGDGLAAVASDDDPATLGLRLCAYVEESRVMLSGAVVHVTASIGATAAAAGDEPEDLLRRAGRLLEAATRGGGNCAVTDVPMDPAGC